VIFSKSSFEFKIFIHVKYTPEMVKLRLMAQKVKSESDFNENLMKNVKFGLGILLI